MKMTRLLLNGCSAAILLCTLTSATVEAAGPRRLRAPREYPLTIREPGSYVLTENLTIPVIGVSAILITANDVTLDLGGFSISGPVVCSGSPTTCTPSGGGSGIAVVATAENTTVRNGTVRGMGRDGVNIGSGIVENVRTVSNGERGIVGSQCVIRDSVATLNGTDGISGYLCVVTNNVSNRNGGIGIHADGSILGNVAAANGSDGISSQGTGTGAAAIHDNVAAANGRTGVAGTFTTVVGNVAYANTQYGITGGDAQGFALNAASSNGIGATFGGHELASNVCGLDITCP